jgi:uncharacterized protein
MNTIERSASHSEWLLLLGIAAILCAVQALRAAVAWPLWSVVSIADHDVRSALVSVGACLVAGVLLLVLRRPSASELGLTWALGATRMNLIYALGGLAALVLWLIGAALDPALQWINLNSIIVTPLFEELLFRGYVWGRLENRQGGLGTWLFSTALFAL